MANPTFKITMENGGVIEGELYPETAPQSVYNFIDLCNHNFYDGLIFHRVISEFMIQGGDPNGNGTGGPGYSIQGEFTQNGFVNNLKHTTGVISMGRANDPDSAGSQFFICVADCNWLDGKYAAFGKVISGLHYVMDISEVQTNSNDKPTLGDIVITSVRVETKGVDYSLFTKLDEK